MKIFRSLTTFFLILSFYTTQCIFGQSNKLIITEIMALNSNGLKDEDNEYSDWIEIYNPGETAVNLSGWHLTDDKELLQKWTFPEIILSSDSYLIVFASDKNKIQSNGIPHTNFKLSGSGEYLALVENDNQTISYHFNPNYPGQQSNISYGIYQNHLTFFQTPTPGYGNTMNNQIINPVFSKQRGFYSQPFQVSLSAAGNNTKIYYTTDGTRPDAVKGKLYSSPIFIDKTTPLSAIAIGENNQESKIISHTYLFTNDIINQPARPAGYPELWGPLTNPLNAKYPIGSNAPADYEMDKKITTHTAYKDLMVTSLKSLPSICLVTNPGYIFSNSTNPDTGGIYIYTGDVPSVSGVNTDKTLGKTWERPVSVEYFSPSDSSNFQIYCGLRLHGGNSRKAFNAPKHSFTLSFRSSYGYSKLNYKLFDQKKATEQFDDLVLRAGYNYTWYKLQNSTCKDAQYITDYFARKTFLDMGQAAPHGKFAHLFINGLYWGVYDIAEKLNKDFAKAYFGGEEDDFDVLNDDVNNSSDGIIDGNTTVWDKLKAMPLNNDAYNQIISNKLLDLENFTDYMLLNFYIGNEDWDKNNWFLIGNRVNPGDGFNFICWDSERSLTDVNSNRVSLNDGFPTKLFNTLISNNEYKLLLADRMHKHFFNDGALTPAETSKRYEKMAAIIDTALISESARWGDYINEIVKQETGLTPYNLNDHWLPKKNSLLKDYFPARSEIVFNQLKSKGVYPSLQAPEYNHKGGLLEQPVNLSISAPLGTIYFTVDGSDPRIKVSSAVSAKSFTYNKPLAVVGKGTVKARAKNGSTWSALSEISFTGTDTIHFIENYPTGNHNIQENSIVVTYTNNYLHFGIPVYGHVKIDVYGIDGRLKAIIANDKFDAGNHNIRLDNNIFINGLYIYKLTFEDKEITGKFLIQ